MKPIARLLAASGAVLLLGACSSAPTRFYTLVAPAAPTAPASTSAYRIELLPVGIPDTVDQPQLVVRQSADRVAVLDGEQWVSPLGDQIHAALSGDLVRQLGVDDVYGLAHAKGQAVYRIKLDVRRFESMPGAYALISAAWSVRGRDASHVLNCTATVRQPVAAGYSALVQGHQQALAQLAAQVATTVRSLAQGGHPACP